MQIYTFLQSLSNTRPEAQCVEEAAFSTLDPNPCEARALESSMEEYDKKGIGSISV